MRSRALISGYYVGLACLRLIKKVRLIPSMPPAPPLPTYLTDARSGKEERPTSKYRLNTDPVCGEGAGAGNLAYSSKAISKAEGRIVL